MNLQNLLIIFLVISISFGCKKENKVESKLKEWMEQNLDDPKGYKPINTYIETFPILNSNNKSLIEKIIFSIDRLSAFESPISLEIYRDFLCVKSSYGKAYLITRPSDFFYGDLLHLYNDSIVPHYNYFRYSEGLDLIDNFELNSPLHYVFQKFRYDSKEENNLREIGLFMDSDYNFYLNYYSRRVGLN